ncbi:MAG: acyl-CoA dehydrogenase family protein [Thermoleophilia bacterium]
MPRHDQVSYRDLRVHESHVRGEEGGGLEIALGMLHLSRVSIAACCVGTAERMLQLGMDYAKKRNAFGKPIASRQAIQGNVAQMATEAFPLERHFCDCRSFHSEEGTEETQKLLIARAAFRGLL